MFSNAGCGPCQAIKPHIEKVVDISTAIVDMSDFDLQNSFYSAYVSTYPTFFVYKNGLISATPIVGANLKAVLESIKFVKSKKKNDLRFIL